MILTTPEEIEAAERPCGEWQAQLAEMQRPRRVEERLARVETHIHNLYENLTDSERQRRNLAERLAAIEAREAARRERRRARRARRVGFIRSSADED